MTVRTTMADIGQLARQVNAATDIVALIGRDTTLKKNGADWIGLCPFHVEKTPSFKVSPLRGAYYCFGCRAKGDAIGYLAQKHGLASFAGRVVGVVAGRVR